MTRATKSNRSRPAHPAPINHFDRPIILFVTVCIRDRQPILGNDDAHAALRAAWQSATHWVVGEYVLMPDHLHLFCAPGTASPESLRKWISYWKRLASQTNPDLKSVWQTDYWDTQIRSLQHYVEKLEYARNNPVRTQLAQSWEDWEYRGIMHQLSWHGP